MIYATGNEKVAFDAGTRGMLTGMEFDTAKLRGDLRRMESMANHTSWHAGGRAEFFYRAADLDDLCCLLSSLPDDMPVLWLGLGSNLLVRDGGLRGMVISVAGILDDLEWTAEGQLLAGAGVSCPKVAKFSANAGFTGAEFLAGIPGTMGGALVMNAGAFGSETWDLVSSVEMLDRSGRRRERGRKDFVIGYRSVQLQDNEWFISCRLNLARGKAEECENRIRDLLARRAATQPIGQFSCGSVFKNPPDDYAARLIDSCGLKGMRIGDACISEKHANFIINQGKATATDIENLILYARDTVKQHCHVELIPEVRIIGERIDGQA